MNKASGWIAPYVQECLSFYLDDGASKPIDVRDDGTNLGFKIDGFFVKANVLTWGIGSSDDGAVLMDSDHQIDASISKDAIAAVRSGSPNPASIGKRSEKHEVELLEFRLVLPYTISTADLRLEVDSFRIDWEKGPQKFMASKKLKRNKYVRSLLERALQKAKDHHRAGKSNGEKVSLPKSPAANAAPGCKPIGLQRSPLSGAASQQLFSQAPINDPARPDRTLKSGNDLHARANLLEIYEPSNRDISRGPSSHAAQSHAKSPSTLPVAAKHGHQQRNSTVVSQDVDGLSRTGNPASRAGSASSLQSQNAQADNSAHSRPSSEILSSQQLQAEHENAISRECHASPESVEPNDKTTPSRKRQRESMEPQTRQPGSGSHHESTEPRPAKKKPRTEVSQGTSTEIASVENAKEKAQPSHSECQTLNADSDPKEVVQPTRPDPWEGLEQIPASEVDIPTEQAEYLNDKTIWISPVQGASHPQGHIPPPLLQQWNKIAERRRQSAEQARALAEQPISPTQDTVESSASGDNRDNSDDVAGSEDWPESPQRQHPRTVLPPLSSPSEQPPLARKAAGPGGTGNESRIVEGGITSEESSCIPQMPAPEKSTEQTARCGSDGSASKSGLSPEVPAAESAGPMLPSRSSVDVRKRPEVNMDTQGESTETQNQAASPDRDIAEASAPTSQDDVTCATAISDEDNDNQNYNDSGDVSDESEMDTSVPVGLGESLPEHTQSTQAEQEMTSSGPSLPAGTDGHVQVAVTPVAENSQLRQSKPHNEPSDHGTSHSAMSSSQANKLSSQSRIMNTYPHHGSYEKSQSSNEGVNSSSLVSPDGSLRVDVAGTQIQKSSLNELPQGATQSQEIVVDSSGPVQRHQDISLLGPPSANEPPASQLASTGEQAQSQEVESSQYGTKENLIQDGSASSPPTRHPNAAANEQKESYSRSTSPSDHEDHSSQAPLNSQSAYLMTRRVGHISDEDSFAEAKRIYKRFCDDYPDYTGDFNHFTELCSKLQSVRAQGQLQRSFMWDDFIIMHISKYPSHIEERSSQGSGTLSYEDYFCLNFTHPLHKKRSLTTRGIEAAASQIVQADRASPVANSQVQGDPPFTQSENANQSFTTSLVKEFSNFHAHSFNGVPQSSLPDAPGSDAAWSDAAMSDAAEADAASTSKSPSVQIKEEGSDMDFEEMRNVPLCSMDTNYQKEERSAFSTLKSNIDQNTQHPPYTANTHDDGDISMDEIDETDFEDSKHETASVELGDDTFIPTATPSRTAAVPEEQSESEESESEDENWFVSLRRMRPTGPVWSDDPNTPFKNWAEAEMNVRSERLQRGGSKILLDDKGVIRRAIYR